MKHLLTIALCASLALPAYAGGPVLEDMTETAPMDNRGGWVVPVLLGALLLCAIACGSDDEAPPVAPPGPICKTGC